MKRIIVSLIVGFLVINGIGYAAVDKNTVITAVPVITTDVEWEVTLNFSEYGGKISYVVFGEAIDANDGPPHDSYDVPLPPSPMPPYIKTWFNDSLSEPYDLMLKDYREYNNTDYKEWNLTVWWVPKSPYPPADITISWNISDINASEYGSVVLYNMGNNVEVDMLENSFYEFLCPAYTLQDFTINCTVIINPVAVDDVASTPEDTPAEINVTVNDYDPDGTINVTTVTVVGGPSHGGTSVNPTTGIVTYTPSSNYHGSDSFTYTVDDDQGATSNVATVSITVNDVNDPPIAVNDTATTPEDTAVVIDILANDYDIDGTIDPTTVTIVTDVSHGSTSVNPTNGMVTYTPDLNYYGPDSFTYTVKDDDGATSNLVTVSITVTDANDPPVAVNDVASTPEDTPVDINVTANDYDIDGTIDVTTVTVVGGPSHGGTSVNPTTGMVTYTPSSNYYGSDSFTYIVKDDDGATSNIAMVSIIVNDVNDPPIAVDDTATTPEDTPVDINVTANDYDIDGTIDVTTVIVIGGPSHGGTSVNPTNGMVTYTPDSNYHGHDSFTYTVDDDDGATSNVATVSITVTDVNDPPIAVDDVALTPEDTPVDINVTANDYDIDGTIDPTTVTIITDVSHGSTIINPTNGKVTYTPDLNYYGPDYFTYTVKDDDGATSNIATVSITVNDVNDPPVAVNDVGSTPEDTPVDIDILANDYDIDGTIDPTTVTIVTDASHGSTIVNPTTGMVTYTPDSGYQGPDYFTYTVKDDDGATSNIATVSITVLGNDPPNKPNRPSGVTRGKWGVVYTYTTSTTDPNNDQIWYKFSWGDGTYSAWVGPYDSGVPGSASHAWKFGKYEIKVKAKDDEGLESEWSDPLPISMPMLQNEIAVSNAGVKSLHSDSQQLLDNHNSEDTQHINPFSHSYRDGSYIRQFINFILRILRGEYSGMRLVDILRTEGWKSSKENNE